MGNVNQNILMSDNDPGFKNKLNIFYFDPALNLSGCKISVIPNQLGSFLTTDSNSFIYNGLMGTNYLID